MSRAKEREKSDAHPDTEAARAPEAVERLARATPIAERTTVDTGPAGSRSEPP